MEFDATFLIAVISFLVFVYLMNKIFYAPILKIIQDRQALVEQNFQNAHDTKKAVEAQVSHRNNELDKSREEARTLIAEHSQKFKAERNIRIAQYKEQLYSDVVNQREDMRNSAIEAKEVLKDNVVNIAKDISQLILGDAVNKEAIDKSKIEE